MRAFFVFISMTLICVSLGQSAVAKQTFSVWLNGVRAEAGRAGVSGMTIKRALHNDLRPIKRIIELDRKQPEKTKTYEQYIKDVVNKTRVNKGRALFKKNRTLLQQVSRDYGVDPEVITALWGIETNYGSNTGGFDVIEALATLAYDGRRGAYFRKELIKALQILDKGHISSGNMKGSWAGAMGQTQFMPSSFFNFAQDYNKNGKRDIWTEREDVFASAANYLAKNGWKKDQPWGREVKLPDNFSRRLTGLETNKTLQFWHDKGVRLLNGKSIPFEGVYRGAIIQPDGKGSRAFIVYENYRVILRWNRSNYFATSVGVLADKIAASSHQG